MSSSSQQSLVKFPLPSVKLEEKTCLSASGTVQSTVESNFKPLMEKTERSTEYETVVTQINFSLKYPQRRVILLLLEGLNGGNSITLNT